jgi:hypothetical protein
MLGIGIGLTRGGVSLLALIRRLFAGGEQGVLFDIADLSTLFQDSAGTTPVTSPGDPVGLMLDKSKGLVLGAQLLTATSINSGQTITFVTAAGSPNAIGRTFEILNAPVGLQWFDGTTVRNLNGAARSLLVVTTGTGQFAIFQNSGSTLDISGVSIRELPGNHATQSVSAARPIYGIHPVGGIRNLLTHTEEFDNAAWSYFGTSTLAASGLPDPFGGNRAARFTAGSTLHSIIQANTVATGQQKSIYARSPTGQGTKTIALLGFNSLTKYRFTITEEWQRFDVASNASETGGTSFYLVDFRFGTATQVELSLPQTETGSTATDYQRVGNRFDVTEAGVSSVHYLSFNGTSQFMQTPSIDFTGTDKMHVTAGVRKLSDVAVGVVVELSAFAGTNNPGSFNLLLPASTVTAGANDFQSTGTIFVNPRAVTLAPISGVFTGLGDISGPFARLRLNGSQVAQATTSQGAGNYGNYAMFIGSRAGTSLFLNGNIYSLIVRGALSDATQIANVEKFAARRTGITL